MAPEAWSGGGQVGVCPMRQSLRWLRHKLRVLILKPNLHLFLAKRDFAHNLHASSLVGLRVLEILCAQNVFVFFARGRSAGVEVRCGMWQGGVNNRPE
jgi:hypothetical protein